MNSYRCKTPYHYFFTSTIPTFWGTHPPCFLALSLSRLFLCLLFSNVWSLSFLFWSLSFLFLYLILLLYYNPYYSLYVIAFYCKLLDHWHTGILIHNYIIVTTSILFIYSMQYMKLLLYIIFCICIVYALIFLYILLQFFLFSLY